MHNINKDSHIPLYYQLIDIILNQIELGELKENDKLPSEREFCENYGVSRTTVRQAIQELEREGRVYKEHGKGTFISPKAVNQDLLKFYSFTEEMKKIGKTPISKILDFEVCTCSEKIAKLLKCKVKDKLYKVIRLRLADDIPMMLETSYLPVNRFPELKKEDLEKNPMYAIFKQRYNVTFTKAEEKFKPVNTKEEEARLLKVNKNIPSMMIERFTFERESIIEYTVGIARGDRFEYRVVLER